MDAPCLSCHNLLEVKPSELLLTVNEPEPNVLKPLTPQEIATGFHNHCDFWNNRFTNLGLNHRLIMTV